DELRRLNVAWTQPIHRVASLPLCGPSASELHDRDALSGRCSGGGGVVPVSVQRASGWLDPQLSIWLRSRPPPHPALNRRLTRSANSLSSYGWTPFVPARVLAPATQRRACRQPTCSPRSSLGTCATTGTTRSRRQTTTSSSPKATLHHCCIPC